MAVQPDGRIVVAASSHNGPDSFNVLLLRYKPDGSLDSTFGDSGTVTNMGPVQVADFANALAIQPDGKILVVGKTNIDSGTDDLLMVRFNGNGFLDMSFGGGQGAVTFATAGTAESGNAVAVDPDTEKILVAGSMADKYVLLLRCGLFF